MTAKKGLVEDVHDEMSQEVTQMGQKTQDRPRAYVEPVLRSDSANLLDLFPNAATAKSQFGVLAFQPEEHFII